MMDDERYGRLRDAARDDTEGCLYVVAHETGRRITSIVSLRWDDWRPKDGLRGTLRWRGDHDKLGQTTVVPVTDAVRQVLERLARTSDYIFPHPSDPERPLSHQWAHNWLKATERRAKLAHDCGGFHAFRRLWVTQRKDLSLKDVAAAGGWKSTATLLDAYQQPDNETLQAVVDGGR